MAHPEQWRPTINSPRSRILSLAPNPGIFVENQKEARITGIRLSILGYYALGYEYGAIGQLVGLGEEKVKTLLRGIRSDLRVDKIVNNGGDAGIKTVIAGFQHGYLNPKLVYPTYNMRDDWYLFGHLEKKKEQKTLTHPQLAVVDAMLVDYGRRSATEEISATTGFSPDKVATLIKGIRFSLSAPNKLNVVTRSLAAKQSYVTSLFKRGY